MTALADRSLGDLVPVLDRCRPAALAADPELDPAPSPSAYGAADDVPEGSLLVGARVDQMDEASDDRGPALVPAPEAPVDFQIAFAATVAS